MLDFLFSCQTSVFRRVASFGFDMGQSGDCAVDDGAQSSNDLQWQSAQRPPQAGGGLWPSSCLPWSACCRVERGCSRSREVGQS